MALNLAPIIPAIFTGPNGEALSPEQIRDRQLIAQSLMGQATDTSPNAGGWASILAKGVQGFQAGRERRGADSAIVGNNTYNSDLLSSLLSGSTSSAASSPMSSASTAGVAQEMAATSPVDVSTNGDTFEPFIGTVKSAITNPYGLAAVASTGKAESGWSSGNANRSWSDPSQSGQPGTAGGILSWRGPRLAALQSYASQKGEKGNGSPQTQAEFFLREDPKLVATLNSAKSVEEAQSAINRAWAFAGYDKPGGEAGRRLQYARSYLPQLQGSTQVASSSPAAAAIEAAAPTSGYVDPMVSAPAYVAPQASAPVNSPPIAQALEANAPQSGFDPGRFGEATAPMAGASPEIYSAQTDFAPELPSPINVAPAPAVASVQQPAAQPAQRPQAPSANTAIIAQALRVMGDPRANDGTRRVAQALLQQEQQKQQFSQEQSVWQQRQDYERQQQNSDPLRQAQIAKLQREAATGGETFFGNPIPIQNPDGSVAYGQIGNQGTFRPIQLGQGQTFAPPTKTIDTGTETLMLDQAGNVVSRTPKQNREAAAQTSMGSAEGKSAAETASEYSSITSKMPGLYSVVDRLSNLADKATYTLAGQALDFGRSQVGMDPREAAVARAEYTATIDNQILPLLKDTFGAQFTDAEGLRLAATLGDANKTPTEKQALLKAFIQQKERDIEALRARTGRTEPQQSSAPAKPASRLKFNPQTGELE